MKKEPYPTDFLREYVNTHAKSFLTPGHEQYIKTHDFPPTNAHECIKKALHYLADQVAPERHRIFLSPETLDLVAENDLPDIGTLPIESPLYFLLLDVFGMLPSFDCDGNGDELLNTLSIALQSVFHKRTLYLLPGRSGQIAHYLLSLGLDSLVTSTDARYAEIIRKNIGDARNARIVISQLSELKRNDLGNSQPDIVISTNMFNISRYVGRNKHTVNCEWGTLLSKLLSIGIPGKTNFFITPALDTESVFDREELLSYAKCSS